MPPSQESQPPVYAQNNPTMTNSRVNSVFTNMAKSFGEQLQERLQANNMRAAELARRSGLTKQGIGRLLNNTPHSITGALPQPEKETVKKIAKALEWNLDDALLSAGYAPSRPDETHDILDIATVMFHDESKLSPEEREELLKTVRRVAAGMISEHGKEVEPP